MEKRDKYEVLELLRKYEKKAGLFGIRLFAVQVDFGGPIALECRYDEETRTVSDLRIMVDRNYINHPYFILSLCHELGHAKRNILLAKAGKPIEPRTTWQWIVAEVSADREGFKIYGNPRKRDIFLWLYEKLRIIIRNSGNNAYKDIVRAQPSDMGEYTYGGLIRAQLVVGIVRLVAATVA